MYPSRSSLILATILLSLLTIVVCSPDIHELSYDYSLKIIDPSLVQTVTGIYDTTTMYQIRRDQVSNVTVKYFLSKPWRLRRQEFGSYVHDVKIQHPSRIIFERVKLQHEGVYSLYIFHFEKLPQSSTNPPRPSSLNQEDRLDHPDHHHDGDGVAGGADEDLFDLNQIQQFQTTNNNPRLLNFTRRDFKLVVHGLKKDGETCVSDNDCESGSCPSFTCVCNRYVPVFLEQQKICVEAKNINETCMFDAECQYYGGEDAECRFSQCLCKRFTVPVKITPTMKQCVRLAEMNEPCFYSKQCSFAGDNRYCNGSYRCDCLPGYRLDQKYNKCVPTTSSSSSSSFVFFSENYLILVFLLFLQTLIHSVGL